MRNNEKARKTVRIRERGEYVCTEFLTKNCKKVIARFWIIRGRVLSWGTLIHTRDLNTDMTGFMDFLRTVGINDIKPFRVDKDGFKKNFSTMKRISGFKKLFRIKNETKSCEID